jgi:hypothetical protein
MSGVDIAIVVIVCVAFVGVVGTIIYKKLTGKSSGCDCGCHDCPHCSSCKPHDKQKNK